MARRHSWIAISMLMPMAAVHAQIAVSANDGKVAPADAPGEPRTADSVAILDIGHDRVRTLATLPVPATVVGPPAGVALTADSRLAIVTAGQILDEAATPVPGDIVTVIDLSRPSAPRVAQTLHAGTGAAGVAINPAGTLVLVANTGADTVSVFTLGNRRLALTGTVMLEPKSRPVDVAFGNGGRSAYVVAQGTNSLLRLAIDGTHVVRAGAAIMVGAGPYSLTLDPRRQIAFVSHLGGRAPSATPGPKPGAIGIVDLKVGRMVGQVDTGITPEHVGLSPTKRYLQVTVNNGSTLPSVSPAFHDHGLMTIYRLSGTTLMPVAETKTGRWCQGAVWSADEKSVLLQCSLRKQIEVYRFDGRSLAAAELIQFDARPGAIATALSR